MEASVEGLRLWEISGFPQRDTVFRLHQEGSEHDRSFFWTLTRVPDPQFRSLFQC